LPEVAVAQAVTGLQVAAEDLVVVAVVVIMAAAAVPAGLALVPAELLRAEVRRRQGEPEELLHIM
jgi:hypothetical protein